MIGGVGILCDYFAAPDDDVAVSVLGVEGGPSRAAPPGFETVTLTNIEPVVNMQTLEELLTKRSAEEIAENPRQGKVLVVESSTGIVTITAELQTALAAANQATLNKVAVAWAETDELDGCDPHDLADALAELAALARSASAHGHQLYCWLSP